MSLLKNLSSKDVESSPYVHIAKDDILSEELCTKLIDEFPSLDDLNIDKKAESKRFLYNSRQVASNDKISQTWKDTIAYFCSPESFYDITSLFADELMRLYPDVFPSREAIKKLRIGVRGIDNYYEKDVLIDAQIRGNTGDSKSSVVQKPHIDSDYKVYSGLLYLRPEDDDTEGGNHEMRRLKPSYAELPLKEKRKLFIDRGTYIEPDCTEIEKTVSYKRNNLLVFVNSFNAIHSVSERAPTKCTRKFLAFTAEMRKPLSVSQPSLKVSIDLFKKDLIYHFRVNKSRLIHWVGKKLPFIKKAYHSISN